MVAPLFRKRKSDLRDLALSLGISDEGLREEIAERIRAHVSKHGTTDSDLRDLLRDNSPDVSSRRSSLGSTSSHTTTTTTTRRRATPDRLASIGSSFDEESSSAATTTRAKKGSKSSKSSAKASAAAANNESDSAEDPLSENQVRNFMEHMQDEIQSATELAHDLEETLHAKYTTIRRGSQTLAEGISHSLSNALHGEGSLTGRRHSHPGAHGHDHHRHHHHHHENGICAGLKQKLCHAFGGHHGLCARAGAGGDSAECCAKWLATCPITLMSHKWQKLADIGSTSTGLVYLTFLLELGVFVTTAYLQRDQAPVTIAAQQHVHWFTKVHQYLFGTPEENKVVHFLFGWIPAFQHCLTSWISCPRFLFSWNNFLRPFFVYYGTLFLLPTLLSQLFNVDRAGHRHAQRHAEVEERLDESDEGEHHRHSHGHRRSHSHHRHGKKHGGGLTGLLSRNGRTTSGLSFFVFKFALTYLLVQAMFFHGHHHFQHQKGLGLGHHHPGSVGSAAESVAEKIAHAVRPHHRFHHNHPDAPHHNAGNVLYNIHNAMNAGHGHGHGHGGLTDRAKEALSKAAGFDKAADTDAEHAHTHPHQHLLADKSHLYNSDGHGCSFLSDVFRFVPSSLSLATAGAGTVLALAESIVARK